MAIPKRVAERFISKLKAFTPVLNAQRDRDVSEADTVTIVKDVLQDVFGYDKYAEVTGEFAIRGTRCDLAIKLDGKMKVLIEVKAIGVDLKDNHVKQAIDYAANEGIDTVILTNGIRWVLYHVLFKKPIDKEVVTDINLLDIDTRKEADQDRLFLLSKEGLSRGALQEYRDQKDATSRFMLAAIITCSEGVMSAIRKEVRRCSDMLIEPDVILKVLRDEVIKREALEGPHAEDACKRFNRIDRASKAARRRESDDPDRPESSEGTSGVPSPVEGATPTETTP